MDAPLSSLPEFMHEAFFQVAISPVQVQESDSTTTTDLSRADFGKVLQDLREQLKDRKLTKETFVVATPADPTNRNGGLAATHVLTAMQDGKPVTVTVAAVLRIQWVETSGDHRGHRQIVTDGFIVNTTW
ncbi:hypothetical protein B0H11DRAFT_1907990 [Mycena galericulata]|nr:hypothetical protein B0H11DRAFT_1907990 [Mycena galericulata]